MASVPFWLGSDDARAWGRCALGPHWLPGVCTVTPDTISRDTDVKKPGGKSGGTLTDKGYKPGKVTIDIWYWTEQHHREWLVVLPYINPRREGATKDPFELVHPAAAELGIGPVYVKAIQASPPTAKGGRKIRITCEEWFRKAKAVKKGTGTVAVGTDLKPPVPFTLLEGYKDPAAKKEVIQMASKSFSDPYGILRGPNVG